MTTQVQYETSMAVLGNLHFELNIFVAVTRQIESFDALAYKDLLVIRLCSRLNLQGDHSVRKPYIDQERNLQHTRMSSDPLSVGTAMDPPSIAVDTGIVAV